MASRASRAVGLACSGLVLGSGAASAQDAPLFVIPTESRLSAPVPGATGLRVALYARDLPGIASALGLAPPTAAAERLEYTIKSYPQLAALQPRTWVESSFVIDFVEPQIANLHDELLKEAGPRPTPQQLVDFVSKRITVSRARGWDVASVVATKFEGDCTEHAVLTAALARSFQMKARVTLGAALVGGDPNYAGYGHAWTEIYEDGRWGVADAALNRADGQVRYIPLGILTEEGPGFELDIVRITNLWLKRIVLLGPQT